MDFPYVFKLSKPVKGMSEEVIRELVFDREPLLKDLLGIDVSMSFKFDDLIVVVSRLTNQPRPVIGNLSVIDTANLMSQVLPLFLPSAEE
jgi:hypothetical protein